MKRAQILISILALGVLLASVAQAENREFWNDGEAEVTLGAYFDPAGTDTIFEGEVPDTLTVNIVMWNAGLRKEGPVIGLEYHVDLPSGLELAMEDLPEHTNMAMGTATEGITQAVTGRDGHGLLINTLTLVRTGDPPLDARIGIRVHPQSGFLRYVHRWGPKIEDVDTHWMRGIDAIINPKLSGTKFKPVKSKD